MRTHNSILFRGEKAAPFLVGMSNFELPAPHDGTLCLKSVRWNEATSRCFGKLYCYFIAAQECYGEGRIITKTEHFAEGSAKTILQVRQARFSSRAASLKAPENRRAA